MKNTTLRGLTILLMVLIVNSCTSSTNNSQVKHQVLCWLNKEADQDKFIQTVKSLKSIPQVQGISVGTKINSIEPVADNSFDLAFTITFKSNDDLKIYLEHADHQKALNEVFKPALSKVVVYDYQEH